TGRNSPQTAGDMASAVNFNRTPCGSVDNTAAWLEAVSSSDGAFAVRTFWMTLIQRRINQANKAMLMAREADIHQAAGESAGFRDGGGVVGTAAGTTDGRASL